MEEFPQISRKYLKIYAKFEDIHRINRFCEIPKQGLFCDLVWADPIDDPLGRVYGGMVCFNSDRGCSYNFGKKLVKKILDENKLKGIIRAHEAKQEGY